MAKMYKPSNVSITKTVDHEGKNEKWYVSVTWKPTKKNPKNDVYTSQYEVENYDKAKLLAGLLTHIRI